MSAASPVNFRTALSSGMVSRSRTQVPSRSVGRGRVAQLVDVGAGIGETEDDVLLVQEKATSSVSSLAM